MALRKRQRSDSEEEELPIAKRINGLSIRYSTEDSGDGTHGFDQPCTSHHNYMTSNGIQDNSFPTTEQNRSSNGVHPSQYSPQYQPTSPAIQSPSTSAFNSRNGYPYANGLSAVSPCASPQPGELQSQHSNCSQTMAYEPDLSKKDNPHYYTNNEVLFYAHLSRTQRREGHEPPS